jgi:hypothetical protein
MNKEVITMIVSHTKKSQEDENNSANVIEDLIELDSRFVERSGLFEFWYRLTAPPKQPLSAPFELREAARLGRLTSTVLAMVAGSLIILTIPTSFFMQSPILISINFSVLAVVIISLLLNRIGKGLWGRLAIVIALNVSLIASILTWPGGLTTNTLPVLDILVVEPTLVALVLLPPSSVFILAFINEIIIGVFFSVMHRSDDLSQLMNSDGYAIVIRPLYLLIFVVGVLYPVISTMLRAIAFGDRAKEIAKVQHDQAEREARIANEKKLLDQGISQLVRCLMQAANGNLHIRAAIPQAPSLQPVVGSLNTLLARMRSAKQSDDELQHTKDAGAQLVASIRRCRQEKLPLLIERTGNPIIDEILMELTLNYKQTTLLKSGEIEKPCGYHQPTIAQ